MNSAAYQWTRHILFSSLMLLSLGLFVMYYTHTEKPDFNLNLFSTYKVSQKEDAYHNILSIEGNMSKVLNPNRTSEKQISPHPNPTTVIQPKDEYTAEKQISPHPNPTTVIQPEDTAEKQISPHPNPIPTTVIEPKDEDRAEKQISPHPNPIPTTVTQPKNEDRAEKQISPHPNPTTVIQPKDEDTEDDVLILIWLWPFGDKFDLRLSCSEFNIKGCHLTDDKSLYNKSHAVWIHHRDINYDLSNMPQQPRPWFQKWVWWNMESPDNSHQIPELNDLFNLTNNYRLDSNIPARYGNLAPVTHEDESFKMPAKDKLVCWVVSNWNPGYKRVQFYNELKKHIKIEVYGKAFGRNLNGDEFSKVISSCKFYLSFENSIYKDYITEKLYNPMKMGTVPVVLGPSRRNYEDHVPGDSFIHVDDFATPKELAERLIYLDNNHTEYLNYFHWKKRFMVGGGVSIACKICIHLQLNKGHQSFHDLNKWYWTG